MTKAVVPGKWWFSQRPRCPVVGERLHGQADESGESALERLRAFRVVDDSEMLVEPDRQPWPDPHDRPVGGPALRLGERPRPRVESAGAAQVPPAVWEVAVQVDTVRVAECSHRQAVRVEHGHQPQIDAGGWFQSLERVDDRDPRRLVAVDAADHEHDLADGDPFSYA